MKKNWDSVIISDVKYALYVVKGDRYHQNRISHGFVINDLTCEKKIIFSDGTILKTHPYSFHYIPKGSTYEVQSITDGKCWAINFDMVEDLGEAPFEMRFKNSEKLLNLFKEAATLWNEKKPYYNAAIKKIIYEIIVLIKKEELKKYMPSEKELIIAPAVKMINTNFAHNDLKINTLASLCGVSEAYFRSIFKEIYNVSPKDYIISKRIELAKDLLSSRQFYIKDIAVMCGYSEPCHFTREFTKAVGLSPKKYIKEN